jgi:hypothetical protein
MGRIEPTAPPSYSLRSYAVMNEPDDKTLYLFHPGRRKTTLMLLISIGFVAMGIFLVLRGQFVGWLCAGFFGLAVPVFAFQFHPKSAYLRLTAEGFTYCSLFRAHTTRWVDVREFGVTNLGPTPNLFVAWDFVPEYSASAKARSVSKSLCGYEAALPDTYSLRADELAGILNSLLEQYGKRASV